MKKVLSLVLALALVLGSFAPVFADTNDYADQGAFLAEMKVLNGTDNGLELEKVLTRAELFTLVSRLMGQEEAALNYPVKGSIIFDDVNEGDWYNAIVGWAYGTGLTTGMGNDMFAPDAPVTVQMLQALMLRVLGYADVAWDQVAAKAVEVGFMGDLEVEGNATRGLMAAMVVNTLDTAKADGTGSLAASLEIVMPRTIVSVASPEAITVLEGGEVTLPETVTATLDNEETKELAVVWGEVDTTIAGEFTIAGTVEEYVDGVEVALTVTAAIIDSVTEVAAQTINEGEAVVLPETVEATFNNGTIADVQVTWTETEYVVGENTVTGTIEGYEAGVTTTVTVEVLDLAVESVTAINLKQVEVKFNKAIDADSLDIAGTDATFKFYKNASTTAEVIADKVVAEDNMSVVLTLPLMAQSDELSVVVENVLDADAIAVTKYETDITVKDLVDPAVVSISVDNSRQLTVTFSEPINKTVASYSLTTNVLKIDGVVVVSKVTPDYVKNTLVFDLGSSITVGAHEVWIGELTDFAGFKTAAFTGAIELAEDATAPVVTAVEVISPSKIKVTFDEPVNALGTITIDEVTAGITTSGAVANAAKTEYTLTVDSPLGLVSLIEATLNYDGTADIEGNASDEAEFIFTSTDDTVKPTVAVTIDDSNVVTVTFDESMANSGTITITDADDATVYTVTNTGFEADTDDKVVELAAATTKLNNVDAAIYTVEVKDSIDGSVRANEIVTATATISAVDTKDPTIDGVINTDTDEVTIYFTETMDAATVTNEENFLVALGGTTTFVSLSTITDATITNNGDNVVIALPGVIANITDIKVLLLKDIAGNTIDTAIFNAAQTVAAGNVFDATDLTGLELIAQNQVKITSNVKFGSVDPSNFVVGENTGTDKFVGITSSLNAAGTELTITLNGNVPVDAAWTNAAEIRVEGTGVLDYQGNSLTLGATTITDKVAPEATVITAVYDGTDTVVTINLTENLSLADLATPVTTEFVVLVDGSVVAISSLVYNAEDTVAGTLANLEFTFAGDNYTDEEINIKFFGTGTFVDSSPTPNELPNFDLTDTVELAE